MRCMTRALIVASIVSVPCAAMAQRPAPSAQAEAVARDVFSAMAAMDWTRVAALVHPAARFDFREGQIRLVRENLNRKNEPPPRDTTMPEAVAQWFEQQRQRYSSLEYSALDPFGVRTIEELSALTDIEILARWLDYHDPRSMMKREMKRARPEFNADLMMNTVPATQRTVIGSVIENDTTIQVLFRTTESTGGFPAGKSLDILTMHSTPDGWRTDLTSVEPYENGWGYSVGVDEPDPSAQSAEEVLKTTVEWSSSDDVAAGSALVRGFRKGESGPKILVVQAGRQRVQIPVAAFEKLIELLSYAYYTQEQQ